MFEPLQNHANISKTKGPIIKLINLMLTLMIDFSIKNENIAQLSFWLEKLKLICKSLLLISENARDKPFPLSKFHERIMMSQILYLLNYLYIIKENNKKKITIHELICKLIKDLGLFILFLIDHINSKYGGFNLPTKEFKNNLNSNTNNSIPSYSFIIYEIFNNILTGVQNNKIITINEIKSLKNEDLLDLHNIVLSDDWIYAFNDNKLISNFIMEYFNDNLYLKLSVAHQNANENKDIRKKCLIFKEDSKKQLKIKIEEDIYELILLILEANEEKKNGDFYNFEKNRRFSQSSWKKIWRKLRINEGIWQPKDFQTQNNNYFSMNEFSFENMKTNKYFYYELWKYEIKNKSRPYLKIKLKEPEIKPLILQDNSNETNFLNHQQIFNLIHQNFYVKSHQQPNESPNRSDKIRPNIAENIFNLGGKAYNTLKSIVANKQKQYTFLKSDNNEAILQKKCHLITTLTLKTGVFTLTPHKMM